MMLDSHPDLSIPPETNFISRVARKCEEADHPSDAFVQTLTSLPRWRDFHLDPGDLERRVKIIRPFDLGEALRAFYGLYASKASKPRWGDKTPPYVGCMHLIQSFLPEARFIHVIRDGRDIAVSVAGLWFGPSSTDEVAKWWAKQIRKARRQVELLGFYTEIRYEDLVREPEATLKQLCDFIDLPWNPVMLEYHRRADERLSELDTAVMMWDGMKTIGVDMRHSIHARLKEPPLTNRIGRWRTEMPSPDLTAFEHIAGKTLETFGYELGNPGIRDEASQPHNFQRED